MIHACCILHNMTCIDGDLPLNGTYDCGGCRGMSSPPLLSTLTSPCVGSVDFLDVRKERAATSVLPLAVLGTDAALTRAGDMKRRHLMDGAFATTLCARAVDSGGTFVVGAHAFHIDPDEAVACVQLEEDEEEVLVTMKQVTMKLVTMKLVTMKPVMLRCRSNTYTTACGMY